MKKQTQKIFLFVQGFRSENLQGDHFLALLIFVPRINENPRYFRRMKNPKNQIFTDFGKKW